MKEKDLFICFLANNIDMKFYVRYDFWKGVSDAAKKKGIKLITFIGDQIQESTSNDKKTNFVYELIDTAFFDGILIWSSALSDQVGIKEFENFSKCFSSLPMVDIEPKTNDKLSSYSYTGMYAGLKHLIEDHNCKKIAYLPASKDNPEAKFRYLAYKYILQDYNIQFDDDLVAPYDFWTEESGARGVETLIDKRNIKFDALAAASDPIAIGAMNALQARGIKIPEDVKIIGFDNNPVSKIQKPSLTSIEAPFRKFSEIALEKLINIINKNDESSLVNIVDNIIKRKSCGCKSENIVNVKIKKIRSNLNFFEKFSGLDRIGDESVEDISRKLFKSLKNSIKKNDENIFLNIFQYYLDLYLEKYNEAEKWENVISDIRNFYFKSFLNKSKLIKSENLFHQARVLLHETTEQYNLMNASEEKDMFNILLEINNKLSTSFNLDDIFEIILNDFPRLNILGCYISFFENNNELSKSNAKMLFAYNRNGEIPIGEAGIVFPAKELIPNTIIDKRNIDNQIVMGLYFRGEEIGFIVYDVDITSMIFFEQITVQLSASIKGAFLVQKMQEHSQNLEKGIEDLSSVIEDMTQNISKITDNVFKQTNTVEENSASIEEMTRNVDGIIGISNTASGISRNLESTAEKGVDAVKKSIQTIQDVQNKSKDILELLDLIQDISNQTNILALNASIEAAHAGESGSGFKIVASEIRQFSNVSKKNIDNITSVVKGLVSKIEESSNFSSATISGLEEIISHSYENSKISEQLLKSMNEEKKAIDSILFGTQDLLQISLEIKSSMAKQMEATEDFKKSILKLKDFKSSSSYI